MSYWAELSCGSSNAPTRIDETTTIMGVPYSGSASATSLPSRGLLRRPTTLQTLPASFSAVSKESDYRATRHLPRRFVEV